MKGLKKIFAIFLCVCMVFGTLAIPAGAASNGTVKTVTLTTKMKNAKLWSPNTTISLKNTGSKAQVVYKKMNFPSAGKIRLRTVDPFDDPSAYISLYNKNGNEIYNGDFSPNMILDKEWIDVPKGDVYAKITINSGESLKKLYYLFISDSGKKKHFSLSIKEGSKKDLSVYLKNFSGTPRWESYNKLSDGNARLDLSYPNASVRISSKGVASGDDCDEYCLVRAYYKNGDLGEFVVYVYDPSDDFEYFFDEDDENSEEYEDSDFDSISGGSDYYGDDDDDDDDDDDYTSSSGSSGSSDTTTSSNSTDSSTSTTSTGSKASNGTYNYTGSLGKTLNAGAGYASTYSKYTINDAASGGSHALNIPSPLDSMSGYEWSSQSNKDGCIETIFKRKNGGTLKDVEAYISALKKKGFSVRTKKEQFSSVLYGLDYNGSASISHGKVSWAGVKYDLEIYAAYSMGISVIVTTPPDIGFGSSSSGGTQTLDKKAKFTCRYDNYGRIAYDITGAIKGSSDEMIIALDKNAYKKGDKLTLSDFKRSGNSGSSAKCMFNVLGDTFSMPDISAYSNITVKIIDKIGDAYVIGFDASVKSGVKSLQIQGVAVPGDIKAASSSSTGNISTSTSTRKEGFSCPYCVRGTCNTCHGKGVMPYYEGYGSYKYHPPCKMNCNHGICRQCGGDGWVDKGDPAYYGG